MARQDSVRSTIYDVARLAGVSHQTVSRHLKGFAGIRPETRARVEQALRDLDYHPNMAARSLATNRSHRIGALAHEMFQVGPSKIMQGASAGAREAGYLLDIVSLDPWDTSAIDDAIGLLNQHDLAGVIASAPTDRVKQALLAAPLSVPLYIESEADDEADGRTASQNGVGTRLLVEHLAGLGHRRILFVSGPREWLASRNGLHAYREAMGELGLVASEPLEGDWSAQSGYRLVPRMPFDDRFTAIVAANDQMAVGILRGLSERGLSVPGDVSVVGFDDIPEAQYLIPPLTTVRVDFDLQGHFAIESILAMIHGARLPDRSQHLHPELMLRASTAPPAWT